MRPEKLFKALAGGKAEKYVERLGALDLGQLPGEQATTLLLGLLGECEARGLDREAVATLEKWQGHFWAAPGAGEGAGLCALVAGLCALPQAPPGLLRYIRRLFGGELAAEDLAGAICASVPGGLTAGALMAVFRTWGAADEATLARLGELTSDADNGAAESCLSALAGRLAAPAAKPEWVSGFGRPVPRGREAAYPRPLMPGDIKELWTPEQAADRVAAEEVLPLMLAEARRGLRDDEAHFRLFGPVNARPAADLTADHPCAAFGGCRMFLCECGGEEDEEDEGERVALLGWFGGRCEECLRPIGSPFHALRRPLPWGGWEGAFCSFACLRASASREGECGPAVDLLEEEIGRRGIQDRLAE